MADALADPSVMSWQELVDELAKQAANDDLLGVLLVLLYCRSNEVNGRTSTDGLTSLEAALSAPLRRLDLRILVVELLLLHGADPDQALRNPLLTAPRALFDVVQRWNHGRRDEARVAQHLLTVPLEDAEEYIRAEKLDVTHTAPPLPVAQEDAPHRGCSLRRSPSPPSPNDSSSLRHRPSSRPRLSPSPARRGPFPSPSDRFAPLPHPPPQRRRASSPPDVQRSSKRPRHGFGDYPTHWLVVANVPITRSERYLHEKLDRRAIRVGDIFLNANSPKTCRYAWVGVYSEDDKQRALDLLDGIEVDGHVLRTEQFKDRTTGLPVPEMADSHPERRYVGPEVQAMRPPNSRRLGLFLLHLPPRATEADVHDFLRRSLHPRAFRNIVVKYKGEGSLAFVDIADVKVGKTAILELDGELFGGQAVRVVWRELDPRWVAEHFGSDALTSRTLAGASPPSAGHGPQSSTNLEPLTQNRYAQLSSTREAVNPSESVLPEIDKEPTLSSPVNQRWPPSPARPTSASPPPSSDALLLDFPPASPPRPPSPPLDVATQLDPSSAHKLSPGIYAPLTPTSLTALTHAWHPSSGPPATNPIRRVEATAEFGSVDFATAVAASKADGREKTFAVDPERQKQFEVFLKAHTGERRDWYTIFFAQLVSFNRDAVEFAQKGHEAALRAEPMEAPAVEVEL